MTATTRPHKVSLLSLTLAWEEYDGLRREYIAMCKRGDSPGLLKDVRESKEICADRLARLVGRYLRDRRRP